MEQTPSRSIRLRPRRAPVAIVLILTGLLVFFSAWNLTRSPALLKAREAYSRGDLARSLQHALDHLTRQPWSREAALVAARSLSRLDYSDAAESYFQRAGRLSLADSQIRAFGLAHGPHPDRAIPAYQQILAESPENVTALRRLAAVLLAGNDTPELLKLAERLGHIPGGAVIGQTLRGVVYHNDKNPQQAAAAFQQVLELDPQLREMPLPRRLFWSHLADDLLQCGRVEETTRYLADVLAKSQDAELMNRLGRIHFLQGSLEEAQRCFLQAAEWDPTDFNPHLNLAKLALQRQEREIALKHLNQARLLAPQQYDTLYNLSSLYRQLGRSVDADRIQEVLKQLRIGSSAPPRARNSPWPRYAL
jgi:tetratricopeptide (TPR) repeat protein